MKLRVRLRRRLRQDCDLNSSERLRLDCDREMLRLDCDLNSSHMLRRRDCGLISSGMLRKKLRLDHGLNSSKRRLWLNSQASGGSLISLLPSLLLHLPSQSFSHLPSQYRTTFVSQAHLREVVIHADKAALDSLLDSVRKTIIFMSSGLPLLVVFRGKQQSTPRFSPARCHLATGSVCRSGGLRRRNGGLGGGCLCL